MTIKEMRETSGLSQIKICELTGVPTRTWRSWETGERACPEYVVRLIRYFLENKGVLKMKKWNIEINWNGAYGSNEWQVANEDGPIEAATAEEAEDMLSPEFLEEHMSAINEDGEMVPVEGAEYRVVEVE